MKLVCDSLIHSYGRDRVLGGVFLSVEPGEIVGIVGRNGSGKTTMLRALLGTLRPDSLHLQIDGEAVARAYALGLISLLPQEAYLPRRMRVARATALALPSVHARELVCAHARVAPHLRKRIGALSGGEARFLELLIALSFPADVVFLDEPFTEIEPRHREEVRELIRTAAHEQGKAIVITDHAYRDTLATSDRIYVLVDGVLREASGEADLKRWGYTP